MISAEQRQLRQKFIGSSDAPAILNCDPYSSAAEVWLEKRGKLKPSKGNAATRMGNLLEWVVLEWAENELGVPLERDVFLSAGHRCANLDAWEERGHSFIVEAKTSGIVGPVDHGYTDDPTDKGVPERILIQTHHQFSVAGPGVKLAYVPVLLGGEGFRMYTIPRSDELVAVVEEATERFWIDHVESRVKPKEFKPPIEVLKRVIRDPGKVVDIPDFLGEEFEDARESARVAEKLREEVEEKVLAAVLDGDAIRYAGKVVEYREMKREMPAKEAYTQIFRQWMFPRAKKQNKKKEVCGAQ